jgi:hypothetical protein
MADLSHWDFALNFSGYESASLMLGFEPRDTEEHYGRVRVVTARIEADYKNALSDTSLNVDFEDPFFLKPSMGSSSLFSVELVERCKRWRGIPSLGTYLNLPDWLADSAATNFSSQIFARQTIADWLVAVGMTSVYCFDLGASVPERNPKRWPWGDHHTATLGHLELAAKKFWVNYDLQDATTAPKNEAVVEWLKNEHNVSDNMAKCIATMLRQDGLPTGPRK